MKYSFFRKINYKIILNIISVIFLLGMFFLIYYEFKMINDYVKFKRTKDHKIAPKQHLPTKKVKWQPIKKDIFSQTRSVKNVKTEGTPLPKRDSYDVLGLVKIDKYFAVIQFKKDKKIKLFGQGSQINTNTVIERIESGKLIIKENNKLREVKIFKNVDIKYKIDKKKANKKKNSNKKAGRNV